MRDWAPARANCSPCSNNRDPEPWRTVMGILAEFLTVRREYAPLIDLALGERSQRFLVRDPDMLAQALRQRSQPFSSRVSFLPLTPVGQATRQSRVRTGGTPIPPAALASGQGPLPMEGVPALPGVIALAEQVVRCDDPDLADLPARLLSGTLIVRDLTAARALATHLPGYRFVTQHGELLEADGTLTVGTHHAETGILSRKSELRELREQVAELDRRLTELDRDLIDLREALALLDNRAENGQQEIDVLSEQVSDLRSRIGQHRQRREGLHEEVQVSRDEISGLEKDIERLEQSWQQARDQAARADAGVQRLHARLEEAKREIREHESHRQERQQEATTVRVALAQVEERLNSLRHRFEQIATDLRQRGQEREQTRRQQAATMARQQENQLTLLHASSALALCYLRKEAAERLLADGGRERGRLNQQRQLRNEQAQAIRNTWRAQQEQAHTRELAVNDLRHRRDSLCTRLHEEYELDLAALYVVDRGSWIVDREGTIHDAQSAEEAMPPEQEIEELRRKLGRLGSVNLDALQELAELEARAAPCRSSTTT